MDLDTYYKLISSEARARKYLLGKCFKNHQRFCPRCRCRKLYELQEGRYRCSRCEYTFQEFSGRWINRGRLSAVQWLSLIKLFELEVSVRKMALQLGLSYRAVYGAVSTIRMAILSRAEDATTLLKLTIKKVRRSSVVYTDKFGSYSSLMLCGYRHLKVDHQKYFSSGRVYINGLEGFWSWAKERLMKHHGVSKDRFPLYLKELEFRYNHRTGDLFDQVANYLCDLVPKQD